ncbi:MAG: hypothetical protein NTX59_02535 [Elusimicrobia bacterium]|nr:hypothetical protein [Elusimicrobiota bacterium]
MNLRDEILDTWDTHFEKIKPRLISWIKKAAKQREKLTENIKKIKTLDIEPLELYASIGNNNALDLRFRGQSIGTLVFNGEIPVINILKEKQKTNERDFGFRTAGVFNTNSKNIKRIQNHLKACNGEPSVTEHKYESLIIHEMMKPNSQKLSGVFPDGIQPVTMVGFPLQVPLPISACNGYPVFNSGSGHIDILARSKANTEFAPRLSVWELKRPGETQHAARQAYIYAVTLLKILRSDLGRQWYQSVCDFAKKIKIENVKIPACLHIDVVVCIEERQKKVIAKEFDKLLNLKTLGPDKLHFKIVTYREELLFNLYNRH